MQPNTTATQPEETLLGFIEEALPQLVERVKIAYRIEVDYINNRLKFAFSKHEKLVVFRGSLEYYKSILISIEAIQINRLATMPKARLFKEQSVMFRAIQQSEIIRTELGPDKHDDIAAILEPFLIGLETDTEPEGDVHSRMEQMANLFDVLGVIFPDSTIDGMAFSGENWAALLESIFLKILKYKYDKILFEEIRIKHNTLLTELKSKQKAVDEQPVGALPNIEPIKWLGTQKELAELFIELQRKGYIKELDKPTIAAFFTPTDSIRQLLQPLTDPKTKEPTFERVFTSRYKAKFYTIKHK